MSAADGDVGSALLHAFSDPVAILDHGPDGRITAVGANLALARSLEHDLEDLPGTVVDALFDTPDDQQVSEHVRRAFTERCEVAYETIRERPHGRYVYLGTVVPISATRAVLVERDISEERRTSRRLHELEALTETGTWSWNLLTGEMEWSPEFRRIAGVGAGFRAHIDVAYDLVHTDDRDRLRHVMEEVRHDGRTDEFRYRVVRPTGERRSVCGRASRAVDSEGRPVRIFGTMQDVTTRNAVKSSEIAHQRMVRQQNRALQLNDDVIQALARAWLALDLEQPEEARQAVVEGMETVRRMMAELLQATGTLQGRPGHGLRPGELAHLRAARSAGSETRGDADSDARPR
jgi:PAS domain S-box-containing protein